MPNLEGVRQLILGSVYSNMGNLEVAKQCYIKAIKAGEATDDVHTSAFASYELGMTLCRNPEVSMKWAFDVKKMVQLLWNTFVFFDTFSYIMVIIGKGRNRGSVTNEFVHVKKKIEKKKV